MRSSKAMRIVSCAPRRASTAFSFAMNSRMRRALTPRSDSPSRLFDRMSTLLPVPSARMRMTMSSRKPNQALVATASMRPSAGARATTSQPIAIAASSTFLKATAGASGRITGVMSG